MRRFSGFTSDLLRQPRRLRPGCLSDIIMIPARVQFRSGLRPVRPGFQNRVRAWAWGPAAAATNLSRPGRTVPGPTVSTAGSRRPAAGPGGFRYSLVPADWAPTWRRPSHVHVVRRRGGYQAARGGRRFWTWTVAVLSLGFRVSLRLNTDWDPGRPGTVHTVTVTWTRDTRHDHLRPQRDSGPGDDPSWHSISKFQIQNVKLKRIAWVNTKCLFSTVLV